MNLQVRFSEQWKIFCTSTAIKGFFYLHNSRSYFEKFFWLSALTCGISLTITDVVETVTRFTTQTSQASLTVINNQSFSFVSPFICHNENFGDLKTSPNFTNFLNSSFFQESLNSLIILNFTEYLENQLTQFWADIRNQFNYNDKSAPIVLNISSNFHDILYLSLTMLSYMSSVDLFGYSNIVDKRVPPFLPKLAIFNQALSHQNVTPDRIIKQIGAAFWCAMGLTVYSKTVGNILNHCRPEQINWVGMRLDFPTKNDYVCVKIIPETLLFTSTHHYAQASFTSWNLFDKKLENPVLMFTGDHRLLPNENRNIIRFSEGQESYVTVQIVSIINSLNTNHCSTVPVSDCFLQCRANSIYHFCNCRPLFTEFLPEFFSVTNLSLCKIDFQNNYFRYIHKCSSLNFSESVSSCVNSCTIMCNRRIYNYMSTGNSVTANRTTSIIIRIDSMIFPLFEEKSVISIKLFLTQLGGNLGLWLGASFLGLLHIFVFILKLPFVCLSRKY